MKLRILSLLLCLTSAAIAQQTRALSPALVNIQLSWNANASSDRVIEYWVYEKVNGTGSKIGVVGGGGTALGWNVQVGTTHTYYVTAVNNVGESLPSNEASWPPPSTPTPSPGATPLPPAGFTVTPALASATLTSATTPKPSATAKKK